MKECSLKLLRVFRALAVKKMNGSLGSGATFLPVEKKPCFFLSDVEKGGSRAFG